MDRHAYINQQYAQGKKRREIAAELSVSMGYVHYHLEPEAIEAHNRLLRERRERLREIADSCSEYGQLKAAAAQLGIRAADLCRHQSLSRKKQRRKEVHRRYAQIYALRAKGAQYKDIARRFQIRPEEARVYAVAHAKKHGLPIPFARKHGVKTAPQK